MTSYRWTASRKAELIRAIDAGKLPAAEAQAPPFNISAEEMAEWRRQYAADGIRGLRVTRKARARPAA
jgi:hypothetical protein